MEEAIEAFERSLTCIAEEAYDYHVQGIKYLRLGRLNEAIEAYDQALEKLDFCLLHLGRMDDAIDAFNYCLPQFNNISQPNRSHIHYDKGIALVKLGRKKESLQAFDEALFPTTTLLHTRKKSDSYVEHGNALTKAGKLNEAIQQYDNFRENQMIELMKYLTENYLKFFP
jgi:tetratricopeptide (TPR) repeat protein